MPSRVAPRRAGRIPAASHGGDLDRVARDYGISANRLIDFSANINPAGPPERALARLAREAADRHLLTRYPDRDYFELRRALAAMVKVPANSVIIADGAAALIMACVRAVPRAVPRGECLLVTPAFAEYERALRLTGNPIRPFRLDAARAFALDVDELMGALRRHRPAMCVLTNPHNPSGALTSKAQLLQLLDCARRTKTLLMVDEAFIDYAPSETLSAEAAESKQLVVLRSVTKFYGMPALRVGYAVATPALARRIEAELPPWPVTTLAASAAAEAVQDHDYVQRTLAWVFDERRWLHDALEQIGVTVYPSAANFLLTRLPAHALSSAQLRARLIADHQIIVRDCESFRGLSRGRFIRVAIRCREENQRLVRALESIFHPIAHNTRAGDPVLEGARHERR
jgi:threonine-phosphate decarboxylase